METLRENDIDAFETALLRARKDLEAVLRRRGTGAADADEVVQEACLRAWKHRGEIAESALLPWLVIVARRILVDVSRRRDEGPAVEPVSNEEPVDRAALVEEVEVLARARRNLGASERRVLGLFYDEGRSVREIARTLDMAPGTVKSHLHRARAALARAIRLGLLVALGAATIWLLRGEETTPASPVPEPARRRLVVMHFEVTETRRQGDRTERNTWTLDENGVRNEYRLTTDSTTYEWQTGERR